jgi:superfamily II DNA or RNA helicase
MHKYDNIEYHRQGYGMIADPQDKDPGSPLCFPRSVDGKVMTGFCNCRATRKNGTCSHFSQLVKLVPEIKKHHGHRHAGEKFAESLWFKLGTLLSEASPTPTASVQVRPLSQPSGFNYAFTLQNNSLLARLLDTSDVSTRFLERIGAVPQRPDLWSRVDLFKKLAESQCSDEERLLNKAGALTRRQAAEQSFWGRFVYHAYREYGDSVQFHPIIDEQTGDFILRCSHAEGPTFLELVILRPRVRKTLALLAEQFPQQEDLSLHPVPLKSIFRVTQKTKLDLEVRPVIQALQDSGEARFFESPDFAKFRYGDLVFIKEMNVLAELEQPGAERRFANPVAMKLKKSQLPSFIDEHRQEIAAGSLVLEGPLRKLSVFREFDRIEIEMDALRRSWYWISMRYGFGNESVSLEDILTARREGKAYLETANGWLDVNSDAFGTLDGIEENDSPANKDGGRVRVSAIRLLALLASAEKPIRITGEEGRAKILRQLMEFTPAKPWSAVKGLSSPLRPYQLKGVDWLRFLFENKLGGLLCDDMGLGKTHQTMALMAWLKEKQKLKEPFLVVCPTTVISHWLAKIQDHAPGLSAIVYHGGNRNIEDVLQQGNVLLTSYGIMRNDILTLKKVTFSIAVFDEVQNLKNRDTLSYQAATLLQAKMRLGLTGTPIENSIVELKSLFDLVLPGYLGSDEDYAARYISSETVVASELPRLRKLISPFTLRRLKTDVLAELPEKIEDVRTCQLSEMQVRLYREALSTKGASLLSQMEAGPGPLPYIHIFALLNLLKRICDHPALAMNRIEEYQNYASGKWDLFQELLFETLDNGQKIVIFTQYLGMISMMERLLKDLGIEFVTLTGSSQDRGEIVRRFNEDRDCRVFLGSLKAGGTGIDLVGGSTVLHYDRWWNAAREDQATDRVHRIGQKCAVQVFKLVTEGTLEEKISAIIERKRQLMNSVVQADEAHVNKIFTREELIELLRPV